MIKYPISPVDYLKSFAQRTLETNLFTHETSEEKSQRIQHETKDKIIESLYKSSLGTDYYWANADANEFRIKYTIPYELRKLIDTSVGCLYNLFDYPHYMFALDLMFHPNFETVYLK